MKHTSTKKLTTVGLLCTLAYIATAVGRVPLILFLKYDPKDVIIVIGGLLFGPLTALGISVLVSVTEMLTVSSTGIWGCLMNVISSCAFACTAASVYGKKRQLSGAVGGLLGGWGCQVAVMMFWNYLVAPVYMGYSREAVAQLLLPAFLPFNVIKGGLNAGITLLLYKPVVTALRRSHLVDAVPGTNPPGKMRFRPGVFLTALLILADCVLLFLRAF